MIQKLDDYLIAQLERFSHWTQRAVGVTAAHWTQLSSLLTAVLLVPHIWKYSWVMRVPIALILLGLFADFSIARNRREQAGDEAAMNPNRGTVPTFFRQMFFILTIFSIEINIASRDFWLEAMVLTQYFAACDDLPGSKSRLREWLESFGAQYKLVKAAIRNLNCVALSRCGLDVVTHQE